jgi:hypothetical protein
MTAPSGSRQKETGVESGGPEVKVRREMIITSKGDVKLDTDKIECVQQDYNDDDVAIVHVYLRNGTCRDVKDPDGELFEQLVGAGITEEYPQRKRRTRNGCTKASNHPAR